MDPVSAVGIASASAQFISFASKLLTTTADIYDSASDASRYIANLDASYSQLQKLCQSLSNAYSKSTAAQSTSSTYRNHTKTVAQETSFDTNLFGQIWDKGGTGEEVFQTEGQYQLSSGNIYPELHSVYASLQEVVRECEVDCQHVLSIISKLKPGQSAGSLTSSFRTAFKTVWKTGEIQRIEGRLQRSQGILATTLGQITNIYHVQHSLELDALRRESQLLGVQVSAQLSHMQDTLKQIESGRERHCVGDSMENDIKSLNSSMRQVSLSETQLYRELDIIRSLSFKTRQLRHDAIPEAHRQTFQWIFHRPDDEDPSVTCKRAYPKRELLNWLEKGEGVFWVSGKPGSGKSTVMKFIANHRKTSEALAQWSHPVLPIISSCYFWRSGSDMQKSLQGLLQTLLFDVFRRFPQLIESACSSRWSADTRSEENWTEAELKTALESTARRPELSAKFCFFIDGLDEFDGDHIDFCEYLTTLLGSNIKLCLSSRPWNVFNDAFGQETASVMRIHELTRSDILAYIQDRLHRHPRWRSLTSHANGADTLAETITNRSDGVFLWVFLVTRLLREGLTNDDSLGDLERRLSSFPSELEPFFKQMLMSVPSFYHEKMARTLHTALYTAEPLETMVYSFLDDEYDDDHYFQHMLVQEKGPEWTQMREERTVRRLNGRCSGLLEEKLGNISFLHRTVADFLKTREMTDFIECRIGRNFNPVVSILKAYAAWLKTSSLEYGKFMLFEFAQVSSTSFISSPLFKGIRDVLAYVAYAENDLKVSKALLDSIIDEIDTTLGEVAVNIDRARLDHFPEGYDYVVNLCRLFAVQFPMMGFLRRKLSTKPSYLSCFNRSPISLALWTPLEPSTRWTVRHRQVLDLVLETGTNPNEIAAGTMGGSTIWQDFLEGILPSASGSADVFEIALEEGLIQSFIEHGARASVLIPGLGFSLLTAFVLAAFDIGWNEVVEMMYFQTLGSLVRRGAAFDRDKTRDAPNRGPLAGVFLLDRSEDFRREGNKDVLERQHNAGVSPDHGNHKLLLGSFEKTFQPAAKNESSRQTTHLLYLRAKLLREILPCAKEACWPLGEYQSLIETVFGQGEIGRMDGASDLSLKRDCSVLD